MAGSLDKQTPNALNSPDMFSWCCLCNAFYPPFGRFEIRSVLYVQILLTRSDFVNLVIWVCGLCSKMISVLFCFCGWECAQGCIILKTGKMLNPESTLCSLMRVPYISIVSTIAASGRCIWWSDKHCINDQLRDSRITWYC